MPNARWLSRPQPQTHTFLSLGHIPHHFWYSSGFPFTCFLILFQQTFFFFFLWLSQHFHIYLSKSFYSLTQARVASLHTSDPQGSWGSESLGMSELIQRVNAGAGTGVLVYLPQISGRSTQPERTGALFRLVAVVSPVPGRVSEGMSNQLLLFGICHQVMWGVAPATPRQGD